MSAGSERVKIVIAPDSFKGSLPAPAVADALARGLARPLPRAQLVACPLADGGEGTLACVARGVESRWHSVSVHGADGRPLEAPWLHLADGSAVLESASVVGLPLLGQDAPSPGRRTSLGFGELARAVLDHGCRRVALALGGSSTNDGGAGLLVGLGARLLDANGRELAPTAESLSRLVRVDLSQLDERVANVEWIGLSDVDNPLTGERGATAVYGPQKGVATSEVPVLDAALARFSQACAQALGRDPADTPGAGAAGGLGYALLCLGGHLVSGADYLIDLIGVSDHLAGATLLITGEGRSDAQTLQGKLPARLAERARDAGVPVLLVSGAIERNARKALDDHFAACLSIADGPQPLAAMVHDAETLLELAGGAVGGLVGAVHARLAVG